MKLKDDYSGENAPFEGDRTLWLHSLPAGAIVERAMVTVSPADSAFIETFSETTSANHLLARDWGITINSPFQSGWSEVDFHARRTLVSVQGTNLVGATLQVDLGGIYANISATGTIKSPDDPAFEVAANGVLPSLTVSRFRLSRLPFNAATQPSITQLTLRTVPTNVSLRLGETLPVWTRLGELTTSATSPDFAPILNAFLAQSVPENGFYAVPLIVHTDAIARLTIAIDLDFVIAQPVLPPHLPEVTLTYSFSTLPQQDLDLVTAWLPQQAIPLAGRSQAEIQGAFEPTRVAAGDLGEDPITIPVLVSPHCSLAQAFVSNRELAVTGIDLPLGNTEPGLAGLSLSIQADTDGKPFGDALTSAAVVVEKTLPNQSSWGSATLPVPFRVLPGVRLWLILQSLTGNAYWQTTPTGAETDLQCSRDSGLSWRPATVLESPTSPTALFRLRDVPERFTLPVQLQIGRGPGAVRRRLDEFAPLGRVEFSFDFAAALKTYLDSPVLASPCGNGELLSNPDLSQPAHDDASDRLFGFGARWPSSVLTGEVSLSRSVNLSVEKFITLSIGSEPPRLIDCAGNNPKRTTPEEIVAAINQAMGATVAALTSDLRLRISPGRSEGSEDVVELHAWCRPQVPQGWSGVPGRVFRAKRNNRGQVSAVLSAFLAVDAPERLSSNCFLSDPAARPNLTGEPAVLSQQIAVSGNCSYQLRLFFDVDFDFGGNHNQPSIRLPRWEIEWFTVDNLSLGIVSETIDYEHRIGREEPDPYVQTAITQAPPEATQATIRCLQPSPGSLIIEAISFRPTTETVNNGDFAMTDRDGLPLGWQVVGGQVSVDSHGMAVLDGGAEDAILLQELPVTTGIHYVLKVRSYWKSASPLANEPALLPQAGVALQWIGATGLLGDPTEIILSGQRFAEIAWQGQAPTAASQVELRLIQPRQGGILSVDRVSFTPIILQAVPLIFLSEAPGELTVSNPIVTYDVPAPGGFSFFRGENRFSSRSSGFSSALRLDTSTATVLPPSEPFADPSGGGATPFRFAPTAPEPSTREELSASRESSSQQLPHGLTELLAKSSEETRQLIEQAYQSAITEDYLPAIASYSRVLVQMPNQAVKLVIYSLRGNAFRLAGNYEAAIADYNQVIKVLPKSATVYYNRGLSYEALGNSPLAVRDFNSAVSHFRRRGKINIPQQIEQKVKSLQQ